MLRGERDADRLAIVLISEDDEEKGKWDLFLARKRLGKEVGTQNKIDKML